MAQPFIGEVKIFTGNFAPSGWAFCDGQRIQIPQNTALFSLLGTTYGGDGQTDFAVPDMQGRAPMHPGSGPGLTSRLLGERGGVETVALTSVSQLPPHSHEIIGDGEDGDSVNPNLSFPGAGNQLWSDPAVSNLTPMATDTLSSVGATTPSAHNNMHPFLTLSFIIALQGAFPNP